MCEQTKTEVMILGSFHFMEATGINFSSEKSQQELEAIASKLAVFKPDKILIEAPITSQGDVTRSYRALPVDYFSNIEVMKNTILGEIEIAGGCYPITYNGEAIQIGYRLASKLNHSDVYGIDYIEMVDESAVYERAKHELEGWQADVDQFFSDDDEKNHDVVKQETPITNLLKQYNGDWSAKQHSKFYLALNELGAGLSYEGSDFLTRWYERNIRIFANLQKISRGCSRVLVIYGAGHLEILKTLVQQFEQMEVVDALDYL